MYFDSQNSPVTSFFFYSLHFIYNILLTWYSGHILDDQDLVDTLQQSKGKSSEITNRVAQSEETEKKLNLARKRYLPVSLTEVFSQTLFDFFNSKSPNLNNWKPNFYIRFRLRKLLKYVTFNLTVFVIDNVQKPKVLTNVYDYIHYSPLT